MNDHLAEQLINAIQQVARVLREDAALRSALASLGRSLAQLDVVRAEPTAVDEVEPPSEGVTPAAEPVPTPTVLPPPAEPLPRLQFTDNALRVDDHLPPKRVRATARGPESREARPAVKAPSSVAHDVGRLHVLADRFAVKAEGCAWHIKRRQLLADRRTDFDSMVAPTDRDVIDRARAVEGGCWMWMCQPDAPTPDFTVVERTQHCYENLATVTRMVCRVLEERHGGGDELETLLPLLAEAQSALRASLLECGIPEDQDKDQLEVHKWLREATREWQVYVPRFMRADDPGDPAKWGELAERLQELEQARNASKQKSSQRQALLKRIAYHASKLRESGGREDAMQHGRRIVESVTALVADGLQPSSVELRDMLQPVVDLLPDELELSDAMGLVLREIDRYVATREAEVPIVGIIEDTADVLKVRAVLRGRTVVLVGGDERRGAAQRLQAAFELERLDWQASQSHESHYKFEAAIRRPGVAVVLLAIRWSSHSFGEISRFCRDAGVPLVRLPGGYGPNQVAAQIIAQAGQQLGITPSAT